MRGLLLLAGMCTFTLSLFADAAYVDSSTGQFGQINLSTGAFTLIGTNTVTSGLAVGPGAIIYGEDSSLNLVTINKTTAATTVVGNSGVNFVVFTALNNGSLFGMDAAENLYSVNATTGAATLVGATGLPAIGGAFSNSLAGATTLYYTIDQTNPGLGPSLYTINPLTGAATLVGATAADIAGSAFVNGTLFGFVSPYINPADVPHFDMINTATGAATFVADTSASVHGSINGGIPPSAVPEPSSVLLLATVAAGLSLLARSRLSSGTAK